MCPTPPHQRPGPGPGDPGDQPAAAPAPQDGPSGSGSSLAEPAEQSKACTAPPAPVPPPSTAPPADLVKGLQRTPFKWLPCRFLYDDRGSQLYEQITRLREYYPFRVEQELLQRHAADIASQIPAGGLVLELGTGDGSKTAMLLRALIERHGTRGVRFCGVDCSGEALRQMRANLARLLPQLPEEQVELVEAEYLAGVQAARAAHPTALLSILWLGSSVGNFGDGEAAELLAALCAAAGGRCQVLLCTDLWKDPETLRLAYDDPQGVSRAFILNGVGHALRALGRPQEEASAAASGALFRYEPVVNTELRQVEMWAVAGRRLGGLLPGVDLEQGERLLVEVSRKFTPEGVAALAHAAGLCPGGAWGDARYALTLLLPPEVALQRCWADTDSLLGGVADWSAQPIPLRHPFCFYYGHVAAFAKLKMLPQEPASELDLTLSRGIDPLVLDPSQCHDHPPVPPAWPTRAQLAAYVGGVRAQLLAAVRPGVLAAPADGGAGSAGANGASGSSNGAAAEAPAVSMHALCMALEHERQHQETLCYMLAQQRKADAGAAAAGRPSALADGGSSAAAADGPSCLPPAYASPGDAVAPFYLQRCSYASARVDASQAAAAASAAAAEEAAPLAPATPGLAAGLQQRLTGLLLGQGDEVTGGSPALWVTIPAGEATLGVDPSAPSGFLWDCERGLLGPLPVPAFQLAPAPVTVAAFRRFFVEQRGYERPELWDPQAHAHLAAAGHALPATWSLLPAAAGGEAGKAAAGGGAQQLWVHMPEGSYRWEEVAACPVYVSQAEAAAYCRLHGARLASEQEWELAAGSAAGAAGQLALLEGGGWEWTSTEFRLLPGATPDPLYPQYAADFGDGQHCVLRGASPYTHPSVARRSFRNWYQPLYTAVFGQFRLARDAP